MEVNVLMNEVKRGIQPGVINIHVHIPCNQVSLFRKIAGVLIVNYSYSIITNITEVYPGEFGSATSAVTLT